MMTVARAPVCHAVIPAAGFGTRFLPWSKAVPKELLPIGDKPVLHYVVEEALAAGLNDITIVLARGKEAICRYFEKDEALLSSLRTGGKDHLLADLQSIWDTARIRFVYQESMKGLGDAVKVGAETISGHPFAVLLGDTVISGRSPLPEMIQSYSDSGLSQVAVEPVPAEKVHRYGICGGVEKNAGQFSLDCMEEKPDPESAPQIRLLNGSKLFFAFAARYIFSASILSLLEETKPGKNGEIQLTDAMQSLLQKDGFGAVPLSGARLDIGNPQGLLEANMKLSVT